MHRDSTYVSAHFPWLAEITAWVFILSVLDGILTIFWVLADFAEEANPLMNILIASNPVIFMMVKMVLVSLGIALLWRLRFKRLAVAGIFICFLVYCGIMIHHLSAAGRIAVAVVLQSNLFLSS
jgi:hypothetical protein